MKIEIYNDRNVQKYVIKNIIYICVELSVKCDILKKNVNTAVEVHAPYRLDEQYDLNM